VNFQEEFEVVSVSQTHLTIGQAHREARKLNSAKYTLVNVALSCGGRTGKKRARAQT